MTNSLMVRLSRAEHQYLESRSGAGEAFANPADYVCDLIQRDMDDGKIASEIAQGIRDVAEGRFASESILDILNEA